MAASVCPQCASPFPEGADACPFDGTKVNLEPTLVRADPLVGLQLGEYTIEKRLGIGGMGVVYGGVQPVISKRVAIKVLLPDLANDPQQAQRLIAEAQAVNAIRHRGIIDIFGFGRLPDGRQYIVMEELVGQALDEYLAQEGPLSPSVTLGLLDELLSALGAAHNRGVIHRDLKPNNLFLVSQSDGSRYMKVLDFGLAKRAEKAGGRVAQTSTVVITGTPEYMAPEQIRAEEVGPETDLYAVGCIAFEMLTGQLPFTGKTPMDLLTAHLSAPVPRPSVLVPTLPEALDVLVMSLMDRDRSTRPHSADVVRTQLKRLAKEMQLASTQVNPQHVPQARAPSEAETGKMTPPTASDLAAVSRSRLPLVLGGVVGVVALLGVGFVLGGQSAPAPVVELPKKPFVAEPKPVEPEPVMVAPVEVAKEQPKPEVVAHVAPKVGLEQQRQALETRLEKLEHQLTAKTEPGEEPDAAAMALLRKRKLALSAASSVEELGRVGKDLDEWQKSFLH